jgi:Uma2 family endonuclease
MYFRLIDTVKMSRLESSMTTFQPTPTPTYPQTQQQPLPTMYDLPSDNPEDPGLPDEFHDWQSQLLSETFIPTTYPHEQVLTSRNLFIYYDSQKPKLYKRPDWFGVVGVPRLVDQGRLSYVFWQEGRAPTVMVELLSENTQEEDQGLTPRGQETPTKWEVYETILRVPYYVVFDGAGDNTLRFFQLQGESYKELSEPKLWIEGLQIGLGLWQGTSSFANVERLWLRWYDAQGNWIPTNAERAKQEKELRLMAEQRAERLAQLLRDQGIDPDNI